MNRHVNPILTPWDLFGLDFAMRKDWSQILKRVWCHQAEMLMIHDVEIQNHKERRLYEWIEDTIGRPSQSVNK